MWGGQEYCGGEEGAAGAATRCRHSVGHGQVGLGARDNTVITAITVITVSTVITATTVTSVITVTAATTGDNGDLPDWQLLAAS